MECFVDELVLQIFRYFEINDLLNASLVCKQWHLVSKSQCLWKKLLIENWPSQSWLYESIPTNNLNWLKIYQEFTQYGWYSPDHMKYFVSCNAIEEEPISTELRENIFIKMANISQKWRQVNSRDYDDSNQISRYYDKNMELFFNTKQLDWVFLDKRRGYMDKYSKMYQKQRGAAIIDNMDSYIRPYQVIPSCLLMYRFLCMFRSFAVPETGLTFYRIWRFRLKHIESGLIFELCDWKAASSSTFSNGCPSVQSFREDALELLQFITHPHFIMHPLGLNPRIERLFLYAIRASAGGSVHSIPNRRQKPNSKKRKHMEAVSPKVQAAQLFGKQLYENPMFPDIEEKLDRWRARRKAHLLQPPSPRPRPHTSSNPSGSSLELASSLVDALTGGTLSRASSSSNLCSESETETDSSQRETEQTTGSDSDSEFDFYENGYVTNCEYFISDSEGFESIEEQHSRQAAIADLWEVTTKNCQEKIPVLYDVEDENWYFQMENQTVCCCHGTNEHELKATNNSTCLCLVNLPGCSQLYSMGDLTSDIIEAIPSALALYRYVGSVYTVDSL